MRKTPAALAVLGALTFSTALPGSAAAGEPRPPRPATTAAAANCTVFADMPATVSVRYPVQKFTVRLSGCEGQLDYASADIYRTGDIDGVLIYDGSRSDTWDVYDFSMSPGSYCTTDGYAVTTPDFESAPWRYDCSTVKFANSAGINGVRRGSYVDISAVAWRYDAGSSSFIRYPNATVALQHRIPGSSTWSSLGAFRLDAGGRLNLHKYAPAVREYRMVTQTSGSFWSASSPTIRR